MALSDTIKKGKGSALVDTIKKGRGVALSDTIKKDRGSLENNFNKIISKLNYIIEIITIKNNQSNEPKRK